MNKFPSFETVPTYCISVFQARKLKKTILRQRNLKFIVVRVALLRSLTGPGKLRHFFNRSDPKLESIKTWSSSFPALYFEFLLALKDISLSSYWFL